MATGISPTSNLSASISQEIDAEIKNIDSLLSDLKKQDSKTTTKQLTNLLISYILAEMAGDLKGAQEIQNQISTLIETYSKDIQNGDACEEQLKLVDSTPGDQTASELQQLQNLASILQQAVLSQNPSILQTLPQYPIN